MADKEETASRTSSDESAMGQHIVGFHSPPRHKEKPIKTEYIDIDISSGNINDCLGLHTEIDIKSERALISDAECKTEEVFNATDIKKELVSFGGIPSSDTESKAMDTHSFPYDAKATFICDHCNAEFNLKSALDQHMNVHDSTTGPGGSTLKTLGLHAASSNSRVQTNPTAAKTTEFLESKPDTLTSPKQTFICDYCNGQFIAKSSLEQHVINIHNSATNIAIAESISLKCSVCEFEAVSKKGLEKHAPLHDEKRRFACTTCRYRFNSPSKLKRHVKKCEKVFECSYADCDFKSKLRCGFSTHVRTHKRFKCSFCDYKCASNSALSNHIRTHTGEKPYKCNLCDLKFALSSNLKKHITIRHTAEKPRKCNLCDYKCVLRSDLKIHFSTHTGDKPYKCNLCDLKYATSSRLKVHLKTHTGEKPYECNLCDYKSAQSSYLYQHIRIHTKEKPYKCKRCDFKCANIFKLNSHLRTHEGEKSYKCNLCDFKCANNSHLRTHTGEKPCKCYLCNFECALGSDLKRHIRTHTGEPYKCNLCDINCARKSNLTLHLRTHTGEKPYKCDLCDFKCAKSFSLKRHNRSHV